MSGNSEERRRVARMTANSCIVEDATTNNNRRGGQEGCDLSGLYGRLVLHFSAKKQQPSSGCARGSTISLSNRSLIPLHPSIQVPSHAILPHELQSIIVTCPWLPIPSDLVNKRNDISGGFGNIHRVNYNNTMLVIKALRTTTKGKHIPSRVLMRRFTREFGLLNKAKHPNIIPLLGLALVEISDIPVMVTPYFDRGTLKRYLEQGDGSYLDRVIISLGIASAVEYLHSLNPAIVHGDIKPANILMDAKGRPHLADFGNAREIFEDGKSGLTSTTFHLGTPLYTAPEMLSREEPEFNVRPPCDVFSLATTISEVIARIKPYHGIPREAFPFVFAIARGAKPARRPKPDSMDLPYGNKWWDLFEQCWNEAPEKRPSACEVRITIESIRNLALA